MPATLPPLTRRPAARHPPPMQRGATSIGGAVVAVTPPEAAYMTHLSGPMQIPKQIPKQPRPLKLAGMSFAGVPIGAARGNFTTCLAVRNRVVSG